MGFHRPSTAVGTSFDPAGLSVVTADDVQAALVELDTEAAGALAASQDDPFGFGLIYTVDPLYFAANRTFPTANECEYYRVTGGGTITKVGIAVSVASGNIAIAVYRNSGSGRSATTGTRLATTGAIACPTAGYAEVSLGASVVVQPGDWFALSCDNTTASFLCGAGATITNHALFSGRSGHESTAHPCPVTPVLMAGLRNPYVMVGVA